MNHITINTRGWNNQLLNGDDFSLNPSEFATFFKALVWEKVKMETSITIKTNVLANSTTEILFETDTVDATWTHPYLNWSTGGFKVGDTIRVVKGALTDDATIESISGNVMVTDDPGFTASLVIVDGTAYDDLEFRNTTVPTSLVYKFGLVPNVADPLAPIISPNPYGSWLDGQVQSYKASGIAASPTALTGTMMPNAEITETLTCEYVSTTDSWIFTFNIIHIFRVIGYKEDYIVNLENSTSPASFVTPNSYRYISHMTFGTDANDPNEFRIFTDQLLNGATGWLDNNFTSGLGNYELETLAYEVLTVAEDEIEATETTTVTGQIKKISGNWVAGDRVVLYVTKLPTASEYSGNLNDWDENFVFDTLTTTEGAASADSDIIQNLVVSINADTTLLDFEYDLVYDATQQGFVTEGDAYMMAMQVGQDSDAWETSDRKIVVLDVNTFAKNQDISGLVSNNSFSLYSSEKTAGVGASTTDISSWNNRLHQAVVRFDLTKFNPAAILSTQNVQIVGMKGQLISRNATTGDEFVITGSEFEFPLGPNTQVVVAGTAYQAKNLSGYRDFNINPTAEQNKWTVVSTIPAIFDSTQTWVVRWPFVVPWRENQPSPTVDTSFYDSTEPNNNLNCKTSNYSAVGDWDIWVRLLVSVSYNKIITEYAIDSTECQVRDFDEDPPVDNWTANTKLYDENDVEVDYFIEDQDIRIETTFSMATAGALVYANLVAEHTIEEYNSTGDNCRLHSEVDWSYDQNLLKPISGETYVKITQDVPNNLIIVESLVDKNNVDPAKSYNIITHLGEDR